MLNSSSRYPLFMRILSFLQSIILLDRFHMKIFFILKRIPISTVKNLYPSTCVLLECFTGKSNISTVNSMGPLSIKCSYKKLHTILWFVTKSYIVLITLYVLAKITNCICNLKKTFIFLLRIVVCTLQWFLYVTNNFV